MSHAYGLALQGVRAAIAFEKALEALLVAQGLPDELVRVILTYVPALDNYAEAMGDFAASDMPRG